MRCGSTEVADVVVCLGDANLKAGLARYVESFAGFRTNPVVAACQFVFARTTDALHDFWCACVECQGRWKDHAHRFFGAVGQGDVVADALAIKVNVGFGGDGNLVNLFSGHGEI